MSLLSRSVHRATRPFARLVPAVAVGAALLAAAGGAQAASPARDVQFAVPSLKGNVDVKRVQFNGTDKLTAWVRLPQGYDDQPDRRWPVLYLLHGWEDNSSGWLDPKKGDLANQIPADFPGIVVMPEGAKAWFINWADPAAGNNWGNYLLDEVVPFMENTLRIAPGRANHAIGGLSMGGYGSLIASAQLPTYFGNALAFSGLLDNQDMSFTPILALAQAGHDGYTAVWGLPFGAYSTSMNPLKNAREYALSRLYLGYGTPPVSALWSLDIRFRGEATLELGVFLQTRKFLDALKGTTAQVNVLNIPDASHTWKWWQIQLKDAIAKGLWNAPPVTQTSAATSWDYGTMTDHGNAWGLGYKLAKRPTGQIELSRRGATLTGKGSGTITISGGAADADSSGNGTNAACTFTVALPFTRTLPAGC
ncbi:MAG: alpha/beta hydrolase-fold protein [Patulibacter minatonensis]